MGTTETEPAPDPIAAESIAADSNPAVAQPVPLPMSLRISAILIVIGLLIEAASMLWLSASAFLVFVFGGGTLVAIGILTYLSSLLGL